MGEIVLSPQRLNGGSRTAGKICLFLLAIITARRRDRPNGTNMGKKSQHGRSRGSKADRSISRPTVAGKAGAARGSDARSKLSSATRRAEIALRASEERFRVTFNQAAVGLAHVAVDGRFLLVNKKLCEILGYPEDELLQKTVWDISHPEDRDVTSAPRKEMFAGKIDTFSLEKRYLRKNGSTVWVNLTVSLFRDSRGSPLYDVSAYEDITQRKSVQEALTASESRHRAVVEIAVEGILIHDADGRIVSANPSAERLLRRTRAELLGKTPSELQFDSIREDGTPFPVEERPVTVTLRTGKPQANVVIGHRRADGLVTWFSMNVLPLGEPGRQPASGVVVSLTDITERRDFEERLTYFAQNDTLTGLPNRALLLDRLGQALTRAARRTTLVGVLLVDLDRFKEVNDSLGHSAGDTVLKEVAKRIRRALRDSDTVARLGGDEFCMVLEELDNRDKLAVAATKLGRLFDTPIAAEGQDIFTSASIGVAVYPDDGASIEDLIKHADIAMYDAKHAGGNTHRFYSQELHARSADHVGLGAALRRAVERNELVVHYQPQIEIGSGRPVGVEALLHWRHPELGILPPSQFIHVAEEIGLIVSLGEWVLKTACAEVKAWQQAGLPQLSVAVNLSARQFRDTQLAAKVAGTLAVTGLSPRFLDLEITESVIMSDTTHTISALTRLADLGVRVSIDDFGTGYSSLAYLKRFPVNKLKIDRAFVRDIPDNREDAAIVQAIITLAKTLELGVLAEGVETNEQLAFLAGLKCDQYQGYHFSGALPPKELLELMRSKFWYFA